MLEEFDQFFIPLSQKSCYSADPPPPSAGENLETKMQTTTFFFFSGLSSY